MMQRIDLTKIKTESDKNLAQLWNKYDFSYLPVLNYSFKIRTVQDIKTRVFILTIIIKAAFNEITPDEALTHLRTYNMERFLTENERWFLQNAIEVDKINETWKSECVYLLLWSLGIIDEMKDYSHCNWDTIDRAFLNIYSGPDVFLKNDIIKLRSDSEIIEMLDVYSRLDYLCDWCKINNLERPVDSAVVYERRYALIWLTQECEWDDIECESIY